MVFLYCLHILIVDDNIFSYNVSSSLICENKISHHHSCIWKFHKSWRLDIMY